MSETFKRCHACRRESCGKCLCGNEVCHLHDGVADSKAFELGRPDLGRFVPLCLTCRWSKT